MPFAARDERLTNIRITFECIETCIYELSTCILCVIDDSNRVNNQVSDQVSIFFAPHETRSVHGEGKRQPVPRRGAKK